MRLHEMKNTVKGHVYRKFSITGLPPKLIEQLGWKSKDELTFVIHGNKLTIERI